MHSSAAVMMMSADAAKEWGGYLLTRGGPGVDGAGVGGAGKGPGVRLSPPRFGSPMPRVLAGGRTRVVRDGRTLKSVSAKGEEVERPHPLGELYTAVTVGPGSESRATPAMAGDGPTDVAVIDVYGVLVAAEADAMDWGTRIGTTYGMIRDGTLAAHADRKIGAIVYRIDSPGGEAVGATSSANELFDMAFGDGDKVNAGSGLSGRNGTPDRGGKPMVAFTPGLMMSAALYLGAQMHAVLTAPAAMTGSIGTIITLYEYSRLLDKWGITVNAVKNPPHKDTFSATRPMEAADRARVQAMVDTFSAQFVADLARGRRVPAAKVSQWVEQMYFVGNQAARAGLADGVVNGLEGAIRAAWGMRRK